ncbi:MAG: DUF202 domain-containing protein [Kitasatospora sp.]|jgi:hypothetical protein|nr:DUF202 domain-containing protein [Kitasatospora sp.]
MTQPDDPEDRDPGLAKERTRLAWVRTAIGFAAVGAALLKVDVPAGVTVLAIVPLIWLAGRSMAWHSPHGEIRPRVLLLMALGVAAIGVVVLVTVLTRGNSPGFHPPHG